MNAEATIKLTKPFHQNFHQRNMMSDRTSPKGYVQFFFTMEHEAQRGFYKKGVYKIANLLTYDLHGCFLVNFLRTTY